MEEKWTYGTTNRVCVKSDADAQFSSVVSAIRNQHQDGIQVEGAFLAQRHFVDFGQAYLACRSQATRARPHSVLHRARCIASLRSATLEQWKSTTFFCDRVAHASCVLVLASRQNGLLTSDLSLDPTVNDVGRIMDRERKILLRGDIPQQRLSRYSREFIDSSALRVTLIA